MILNDEWSEWSGDLQAFPRTRCHVLWLHGTGHFAGLLTLQLVEWRGFGQCTSDLLWHETRLEGRLLSYENKSRCCWLGCCICNSSYSCVTVIAVFSDLMIMRTWCLWPVEGGQGIHFSAALRAKDGSQIHLPTKGGMTIPHLATPGRGTYGSSSWAY